MEREILVNMIMAMDGTILISHHRWDYKTYTCMVDGMMYECMVDGGQDYLRRGGNYTEMSLYTGDDFKVIRMFLCRGGRGEDGTDPLTYTPLFKINDDWLDNLIKYEQENRPDNKFLPYYIEEKKFRGL